ncbi:MAG: tetratricopeptide repeat protein [candidate division WOR-3 bacterium]|nr:MAG: tetratricopeptide repeat protein [candidate division WOR-3 bacterium]
MKRIEKLSEKVRNFDPQEEDHIRKEIEQLYTEIADTSKALTQAQEDLKTITQEFKSRSSAKTEVDKFYSFVKSQTSAELDIATLNDRAWNLICMKKFAEAIKVASKVLTIDPKNVKALGYTGFALMNQEMYDDAMLYFQEVLLIDSDNPFALNNLGYICYKKGIWGEAIEHLTNAAKQTKDRMAALYANYYLGLVYYDRNMIPDAVKFLETAVKLGPNLQEAYYYLGLSETKQYEFRKAVKQFEKCIKIDPESRYGTLAKEELAKIKPLIEPEVL